VLLQEELQERQLQLANQQQAVDESAMQATAAAAALQEVVSSVQQLQQQLLLAEHGCQLLQKEAEAAVHQQQQLQHQAQRMSSLQQQQELVQQQLAAAQQDVARLQALLDSAAQAGSMAEQQARQVQLLQQQAVEAAAAVQQQQEQESQDQQQLQLAEQHLAGLQQQMQQLADAAGVTCEELLQSGAHTAASKTSSSSSKGALEALQRSAQQYQQQLLAADVKVSQLQAQLSSRVVQTLQRMLPTSSSRPSSRAPVTNSSRSGVGSSAGRSLDTPGGSERADMCCVMDAFTVRNAADPQVQQLAPALAAVCGISTLGVVLVEGSVQVQQVLSALQAAGSSWRHGKVRLWPLDQLQARDLTHKQRAAQAGLGASKVFLPLDMLEFGPKYQPAMQRAFGGYVIAVDDATAAEVVNKYGLSCVTLQGTVSHKGSMSGGWSGPQANPALQRWQQKLQLDAASQLRQELQGSLLTLQLQIEQEEVQQAQQQEVAALCMQVEDGEARRAAAATQHAAAVMLLQQLQQQAEHCQVRLHQQQQQEQKPGGDWHAGGGRSAAEAHQELQEQHAAAAAKAAALETQLESLAEQVSSPCASVDNHVESSN
jgi:chromosome segregation ATPase